MTINELLEYLDGNGMIYVDEDLVTKALSEIGYAPFDEFERVENVEVEIKRG
jgi:hypothetical protein